MSEIPQVFQCEHKWDTPYADCLKCGLSFKDEYEAMSFAERSSAQFRALVRAANMLPKCVAWINEVVGDSGLRCDRDVVDRGRNLKAALLSECEPTRAADGGGDEV